jgi:hypothetical protein
MVFDRFIFAQPVKAKVMATIVQAVSILIIGIIYHPCENKYVRSF